MIHPLVMQAIQNATSSDINDLLLALCQRHRELFPDWEVLYISCPKNNPQERQQTLEYIIRHFENTGDCHTSVRTGSQ